MVTAFSVIGSANSRGQRALQGCGQPARQATIVPFTAAALPLIFLTPAALSLQGTKALMTRERATKTAERLPINSGLAMFFTGGAFLAYAITALVKPDPLPAGDILFLLLSLTAALCAVLILAKTHKMKPCIEEKTEEVN